MPRPTKKRSNKNPMREEVQNVKNFICDSLRAADIPYETEVCDENPDVIFIAACDKEGYENSGMFGWGADNRMCYVAFNPMTAAHDDAEGVPEDESKCFWNPKDAEMMTWFLNGKVRKIMYEEIARTSR